MHNASVGGVAGKVGEEPWGATLAGIAHRRLTGQLQLRGHDAKLYRIAFVDGRIVAASSPNTADSIARIALTGHLINATQAPLIAKRIESAPGRDEIDVLTDTVRLSTEHVIRLRKRAILQRAARTFAVEAGDYRLDSELSLTRVVGIEVDVRAIVALGARMNLSCYRLSAALNRLGERFKLDPTAELSPYDFGPDLAPVIESLKDGATVAELDARHRDIEPRMAQSILYALVTCGAAEVVERKRAGSVEMPIVDPSGPIPARSRTSSVTDLSSRTRTTDWPGKRQGTDVGAGGAPKPPALSKPPSVLADEAFQRGVMALRRDDIETAVLELVEASRLSPLDVDYAAMAAWAKFCAASDKQLIALDTRRVLERAVARSQRPMTARFYLGRVERMLGRVREALYHFRQVIAIEPGHADAAAEIRMLEPRAVADRR
jgi:hypothetical protein